MKPILNKLGYAFIFLFIAGILATGMYLFNLPDLIVENTSGSIQTLLTRLDALNFIVMGTAFLGLSAITFLLVGGKNTNTENIVYVETYKNKDEYSKKVVNEVNNQSKYDSKVEEIQKIIDHDDNERLVLNRVLSKVCKDLEASQGAIFKAIYEENSRHIELWATFAYSVPDSMMVRFEFGEGLAGQAAKTGNMLNLKNVPEGYIKVLSGLGSSTPTHLIIIPMVDDNVTLGVVEIASFKEFSADEEDFLKIVASLLAKKLKKEEEVISEEQVKN